MRRIIFSLYFILIILLASCVGKDTQKIKIKNNAQETVRSVQMDLQKPVREEIKSFFTLYITENKNSESLYDSYVLFIKNNKTDTLYKLFTLSKVSINSPLNKIYNNFYSYKYFTGGNDVNAECFQLIQITKTNVSLIGKYKGYDDIDGDGIKDFYILVETNMTKSHADFEYKKTKIEIKDNHFIYPKEKVLN